LEIAKAVPVTILEHHILRDESWRDKAKDVFDTAKRAGNKVMTAAELLGKKETCLEASRKQLYIDVPPSKGFQKWMRMDDEAKKRAKPPI
jgi:predicted metallo-beta-lactamase superfamily hydrolase